MDTESGGKINHLREHGLRQSCFGSGTHQMPLLRAVNRFVFDLAVGPLNAALDGAAA